MNDFSASRESEALRVARKLTQLHQQTAQAREVLAQLQQDALAVARQMAGEHRENAVALVEVNEQLVMTLVRSQSEGHAMAETAKSEYSQRTAELNRRQEQLQEANQHLVLAALGAQALQAAAEKAHQRQMEMLAVISHELRQPLTPIGLAAAMMGKIDAAELPRVQAMIRRQVAHITRLVSDLLDVSRFNTGKFRVERQPVDLRAILIEAEEASRPAMDARTQLFNLDLPFEPLHMAGDAVRLVQVFRNLLDNASKYTPHGGEISLVAHIAQNRVIVTVVDSGIGISADGLTRVFDPFVQDPHAVEFDRAGLGIGLTVVRELVEAHGGTVVAFSEGYAQGSRFVVTLPLTDVTQPALGERSSV